MKLLINFQVALPNVWGLCGVGDRTNRQPFFAGEGILVSPPVCYTWLAAIYCRSGASRLLRRPDCIWTWFCGQIPPAIIVKKTDKSWKRFLLLLSYTYEKYFWSLFSWINFCVTVFLFNDSWFTIFSRWMLKENIRKLKFMSFKIGSGKRYSIYLKIQDGSSYLSKFYDLLRWM